MIRSDFHVWTPINSPPTSVGGLFARRMAGGRRRVRGRPGHPALTRGFQLPYSDADRLRRSFAPLATEDLSALEAYEIALRPCVGSRTLTPATGLTSPLGDRLRDLASWRPTPNTATALHALMWKRRAWRASASSSATRRTSGGVRPDDRCGPVGAFGSLFGSLFGDRTRRDHVSAGHPRFAGVDPCRRSLRSPGACLLLRRTGKRSRD
jgi:hypothetical protein